MSTASRGELPSDDIGQLVEHCRQSRKYSRMITVGIVLFAVVLACRCGWLWQHNGTLDVAIVLGIFTLLGMLVLRVVARDSQKISMDRFAPGGTDVVAVALQTVSDLQMQRFRARGAGGIISEGLWKYSRHPNYLGEILMWWGVAIYSICLLGFRWYLILGAVLNNLMFLFISIPMADRRQSRKPGYEEYRQGKNHLVPIRLKRQ